MKKIALMFIFSLLLASCGSDWHYTELDVKSEITDPFEFMVKVADKVTTIRSGETKTVFVLEPTTDQEELASVEVVFSFNGQNITTVQELKTREENPGQVLLKVAPDGDEIAIERYEVVY